MKHLFLKLNVKNIYEILRLWSKHGVNLTSFSIYDIEYLISKYLYSNTVKKFYNYYVSLPLDVQETRYFKAITHYKNIYCNYATDDLLSACKNPGL